MAIIVVSGGSFASCPIEAIAYLNAQGITDPNARSNYCQFVQEALDLGVYSLFEFVYPSLGTSALTNNLNAVNPVDSDVAFRRKFFGGFTSFSPVTGIKGDGVTGYFRTYYNTSNMTLSSGGGMVLEVLSEGTDGVDVEAYATLNGFLIYSKFGGLSYVYCNNGVDTSQTNATAVGTYMINRPPLASTSFDYNIKGVDFTTPKSYANPNSEIFGLSRGGTSFFTTKAQGCLVGFKNATTAQAKLIQQCVNNLNSRR